jgi:zinc resistance-associated protein
MRRKTASKRGRSLPLLAACAFGYLIGAWHVTSLREAGRSSAAEVVAQRFPQEWNEAAAITVAATRNSPAGPDLFSPAPMAPALQIQSSAEQPVEKSPTAAPERRMVQMASLESIAPPAVIAADSSPRPAVGPAVKPSAAGAHPAAASRAGYMLDDAQIASIKKRLHLTPDQERMWPAVEAALRNMAYKRTQQAAARGATRNMQAAAVDPEAVEGLKSAAVPLIMSFSSEQKEEVRSLAHVMGLDQLASQF